MKSIHFNSPFGEPIFSSTIHVPKEYVFENHINSFLQNSGESIQVVGIMPKDENFTRVSNRFHPGKTYRVEIVPIIQYMAHCNQCLEHLKQEKDILFFGT